MRPREIVVVILFLAIFPTFLLTQRAEINGLRSQVMEGSSGGDLTKLMEEERRLRKEIAGLKKVLRREEGLLNIERGRLQQLMSEVAALEVALLPPPPPRRGAWLGMGLKNVSNGVEIAVFRGGPAEKGGLENGDIIIGVGKKETLTDADVKRVLTHTRGGEEVEITFYRGEHLLTAFVRTGNWPN